MIHLNLSSTQQFSIMIKRITAKVWLGFFLVGLVALVFTFSNTDFKALRFALGESKIVEGQLINYEESSFLDDDGELYRFEFSYEVNGEAYTGNSLAPWGKFDQGATVKVQYLSNAPEVARIEGTKNAPAPFWGFLAVAFLPFLGLIGLRYEWRKVSKVKHVLANGILVAAQKGGSEKMQMKQNDKDFYKVTYNYMVEGATYGVTTRSTAPESLPEQDQVVYQNSNPSNGVLLANLSQGIISQIKNGQ